MTKTITIGIPVYNERKNIKKLLSSLLSQKQDGFRIENIIVSSDGSTDGTTAAVKSISHKNIRVNILDNKSRMGIARGLNQIIGNTKSDILVTLDGDIQIKDNDFILKLVMPIIRENADLTSSAISELPQKSRIAKTLHISMLLKKNLFMSYLNGNNLFMCHGLARGYSKKMYSKLNFPVSIGNDMYSYLYCIKKKYKFEYINNAIAYYRIPETYEDHKKQSLRYFVSADEQAKYFTKAFVKMHTHIPFSAMLISSLSSVPILIKNPLEVINYVLLQFKLRYESKNYERTQMWDMVTSSKNL